MTMFSPPIRNLLEFFENNNFSNEMYKHVNRISNGNYTCKYYTDKSFPSALQNHNSSPLKIFHTNIRSLQLHSFELYNYLEILNCQFDVILVTELGKPNIGFVENIFKGYTLYYQESDTSKGGAGALIKTSSFDSVTLLEGNKFNLVKKCDCEKCRFENVWLKLTSAGQEYIIGSIYRHPGGNIQHFIDAFSHILNFAKEKSFYIWAGDINVDTLKYNTDKNISNYITKFIETNFIPCITLPTRFTDVSATLIDHIMVRVPKKFIQNKVTAGNLVTGITDHLSNFVVLDTKLTKNKKRPLVRIFTKHKIQDFNSTINNIQPLLHISDDGSVSDRSVDENFSELTSNSINLLNKYFPLVKLSRSKARDKPYMSAAIKVSIRHKHKLYNNY